MPGNREVAVGGGADRLSDLPDGILEHVLSFLPAADAVRTSVLSRRFRTAWAHAPPSTSPTASSRAGSSASRVRCSRETRATLGVFLSSCCPQLRKLRLSKVSGGLAADGGLTLWPLVLHLDLLEELAVDRVETFTKLQVASSNLRTLGVLSCFESFLQWAMDTVVEISAPRLEDFSWSGTLPKHLSFLNLNGSHCIRRLRLCGLRFYLPGKQIRSASAVRLLEMCSRADHLILRIDIPDSTSPPMLNREELKHVPHLPNIRVLSLEMFSLLQLTGCPIAPVISSFLRRCPNLTQLHIDLLKLNIFSRLNAECFMVSFDLTNETCVPLGCQGNDETEMKKAWQSTDRGMWKRKTWRDQQQLSSLGEIRLGGFMGTDREMEVAGLLFGVGASQPALEVWMAILRAEYCGMPLVRR
ncbi:unnamed protein product [Miscanthus lutarioriparius]|uniref:F-box domain-containing protein n=1 Tax=Miscanthus lutarioriparius TaxID=422564 RepID=A0A811N7M0_9POAL|nr:unnamed protein product [Miscanthus lutarioriparius]